MKKLLFICFALPLFAVAQTTPLAKIEAFRQEGKNDKAVEIIDELIKNKKANKLIYFYKAGCEQELLHYGASVIAATQALKLTKKSDSLYRRILFVRGMSYAMDGHVDEGIADYQFLIKRFPKNIEYLTNISYIYGMVHQYSPCLQYLKQALVLDTLNWYIFNNLAYYSGQIEDYRSALTYATKALPLAKDSFSMSLALNNLGYARAKSISMEKGIEEIHLSISYLPENPYTYYNLGLLYLDKKEPEKACEYFKQSKEHGGTFLVANYLKECD